MAIERCNRLSIVSPRKIPGPIEMSRTKKFFGETKEVA